MTHCVKCGAEITGAGRASGNKKCRTCINSARAARRDAYDRVLRLHNAGVHTRIIAYGLNLSVRRVNQIIAQHKKGTQQ